MAHVVFQGLFFLFLLQVVPGCRGTETVSAVKEENVALLCLDSNEMDLKSRRARCLKYATDTHPTQVIFEWPNKSRGYGRVMLEADENGHICLFLKTLQKSDAGLYSCEIWEAWDTVLVKNISLKVKDCRVLQAVKAAPQTPVKLNCQVNITSGLQEPVKISWKMLKGKEPPVDPETAVVNGTFLAFQSVTTSDSGWYRCTLEQTQRCSEINLLVTESTYVATTVPVTAVPTTQQALTVTESEQISTKEPSREASVPVVAIVVIGILILVVSTGFFIYRRHKTQKERQQELRQPAGCPVDSLDAYENLTLSHLQDSDNRVNSLYLFQEESVRTFRY